MAFENFFSDLTQVAVDSDYEGVFGTSGSSLSLSSNLSSLSAEGSEIVRWIRYRLGEPKLTVELDNVQIFSAFEEANIEYSSIINRFQAKNWLSNLLGLSRDFTTADFTNKLPHQTLYHLNRLAAPFASEAGIGGVQNVRKAYATMTTDGQDYNLLTDFVDQATGSAVSDYVVSQGGARIDVRKVWHAEPSSVYRFYDPYSSANMLTQEFQFDSFHAETIFYVFPIWTDILRAGQLEVNDRVRRSNHSYNIVGDRLRLLPQPTRNIKVWIEYAVDMDPFNPDFAVDGGDPSVTGIANISNVPFKDIAYSEINAHGRRWIRQYSLAISYETLGRIRRKFASIPIPNAEVTMDGDALVQEGLEMQRELEEKLKEELEETSNLELMRQDAELAEHIEQQYSRIPFSSPILFMG